MLRFRFVFVYRYQCFGSEKLREGPFLVFLARGREKEKVFLSSCFQGPRGLLLLPLLLLPPAVFSRSCVGNTKSPSSSSGSSGSGSAGEGGGGSESESDGEGGKVKPSSAAGIGGGSGLLGAAGGGGAAPFQSLSPPLPERKENGGAEGKQAGVENAGEEKATRKRRGGVPKKAAAAQSSEDDGGGGGGEGGGGAEEEEKEVEGAFVLAFAVAAGRTAAV